MNEGTTKSTETGHSAGDRVFEGAMSVMLQRNDSNRAQELKERMGRSRRDQEDEKEWVRRK